MECMLLKKSGWDGGTGEDIMNGEPNEVQLIMWNIHLLPIY